MPNLKLAEKKEKISPCPHCNSNNIIFKIYSTEDQCFYGCLDCGLKGPVRSTVIGALHAWETFEPKIKEE